MITQEQTTSKPVHQASPATDSPLLDYAASLRSAILRSIGHNEIVRVELPLDLTTGSAVESYLSDLDEMDSVDHAPENDGTVDMWGTFRGEDFRIRLVNPEAR